MSAAEAAPVSADEAAALFADLADLPALILAVSGGPDSTALLVLAARWRAALARGPALTVITVDHGLRPQSRGEAQAVKALAGRYGLPHRTLRWTGSKPATGLQEAARAARYRLLSDAARKAGAGHIVTAHTLDDQAETVIFRMARGSGLTGLGAMARAVALDAFVLLRPLLDVPKARLIATLAEAGLPFADDPSNRDPRFARARLRALLPALAQGLDAHRLAVLARRLRRADATVEVAVEAAVRAISDTPWPAGGPVAIDAEKFARLPQEVVLRVLGRAVAFTGREGTVQLGKLEMLCDALMTPGSLRRTLAGALVTRSGSRLVIAAAPPRRAVHRPEDGALTTGRRGSPAARKR